MITNNEIIKFIEENINFFHNARLKSLQLLKIEKLLKRKNPYLFRCKDILLADELVKFILDAHLSSQEETIFGNFLGNLAIFINTKIYNGFKSSAEGIDLEFIKDNVKYIVSIKSGPNWGNSSQIKKMKDNFQKAQRILRTNGSRTENIIAINGCCYGIDNQPDKGYYFKYCGQAFWELISGDLELYTKIIEPLGHKAKERNEEFNIEYARIINNLVKGFISKFCNNGKINWELLVEYNSKK
ncbi:MULTISPECIES: PmeII family type II restriction endonuclease [unclassified Rickettsia]|uniref:PmeII family type II restriction endonuclease n=1 Tax=unclassified Rickettsia TaxID=114295 RepID=UPI0031332132